jgi:L-ectoine synthase
LIVRSIEEISGTDRDVHAPTWTAKRLLLRKDKMGFSLHETTIYAGTETSMWYANHLEAVYCVEGRGEIEDTADGRRYEIRPGIVYALDKHDKHIVRCHETLRLVCVFNPPVAGREVHDENGVYPLIEEDEEEVASATS